MKRIKMNLNEFNFANICRLCLRSVKELKDIFESYENNKVNLSSKIMACVSIKVKFYIIHRI